MSSGVLNHVKQNLELIKIKQKRLEVRNRQIHGFGYDNAPDYYISEAEILTTEIEHLKEENYQLLDKIFINISNPYRGTTLVNYFIVVDLSKDKNIVDYVDTIISRRIINLLSNKKNLFYYEDIGDEYIKKKLHREDVITEICYKLAMEIIDRDNYYIPVIISQYDIKEYVYSDNIVNELKYLCIERFGIHEEDAESILMGKNNIIINNLEITVSMRLIFIIGIYNLHNDQDLLSCISLFQKFVNRHKHYMLVVSDEEIDLRSTTRLRIIGDDNENISPV